MFEENDFKIIRKTRLAALIRVVEYACMDDYKEYEDFIRHCEETGKKPSKEWKTSDHVYALALRGLGMKFQWR